ncbi:MAG: hypothetical protein Q4B05_00090 [Candidatus Saccharibacteria bacterium]|nr:hypothetical protein [Candidatus Saccharibacteria bacterium]
MNSLTIKRFLYRLRRDYVTLNNAVIAAAACVALSWAWGSVESMQYNYRLQQMIDTKRQQAALETLRVSTLELEGKYYATREYQELALRQRLGLAYPGEQLLIVPSTDQPQSERRTRTEAPPQPSNVQQWMNFLFGAKRPEPLQKR